MSAVLRVLREILHLFVDDSRLAAALILWSAAAFWLLPRLLVNASWDGIILLLGHLAILGENLRRSTRR